MAGFDPRQMYQLPVRRGVYFPPSDAAARRALFFLLLVLPTAGAPPGPVFGLPANLPLGLPAYGFPSGLPRGLRSVTAPSSRALSIVERGFSKRLDAGCLAGLPPLLSGFGLRGFATGASSYSTGLLAVCGFGAGAGV